MVQRSPLPSIVTFVSCLFLSACSGASSVPNSDVGRELWKIYEREDKPGKFFFNPALSPTEESRRECRGAGEVHDALLRAGYCETFDLEATDPSVLRGEIAKFNSFLQTRSELDWQTAKTLSTFFHGGLRFSVETTEADPGQEAWYRVGPTLVDDDLREICPLDPLFQKGNMANECARARSTSKNGVWYSLGKDEAEAAARELNKLYGIAP